MDELITQVTQRTGLAPDKARAAVDTIISFLKTKLPGPIAAQLDAAVSGKTIGGLADAVKGAGDLFGKK